MRKRSICFFIIISISILWLVNQYVTMLYDVNIAQYISYSQNLTQEEKDWLIQHGPLIYGADKDSPPLRYVDNETKQYKGVVVDYLNALSIELGVEIKFKPLVWQNALSSLEAGKTDLCDMFSSEERRQRYFFTNPIYNLRGAMLVPSGGVGIGSYLDLQNKKVAVVEGDYVIEDLRARTDNINFVLTNNVYEAIQLLQSGTVDAVAGDEPVISYYIDKMKLKDNFKMLDKPLYEANVILAVPKSEKVLVEILNKGIFNLKKKSVLEKIQQKWFGISVPTSQQQVPREMLVLALVFTLGFLMILYIWNEKLKTEVEKRTEELNLSRDDLQKIFDVITYFMIVFDEKLNVMNANKAFCRYIGKEPTQFVGKNYQDITEINCSSELKALIQDTMGDAKERNSEYQHDGQVYQANTFPLVDKNKKVIKVVAAIRNVTELKINEKQLLQESKMAAIGQLAAGIAHEIRNPLGLIRNYMYILKRELDTSNEKSCKAIDVIEASVERSSGIISNLLNFSSISGESNEWVNVGQLIETIVALERKVLQTNKIEVDFICAQDIRYYMNQESLKHILINLISNAIDAMPAGGVLRIHCSIRNNALYILMKDNGMGIAKENLDNIFHPFFTTKLPGKGTGLGLYITYNEVQKFGGEIQVSSELNMGTMFEVTFPIKKERPDEVR